MGLDTKLLLVKRVPVDLRERRQPGLIATIGLIEQRIERVGLAIQWRAQNGLALESGLIVFGCSWIPHAFRGGRISL